MNDGAGWWFVGMAIVFVWVASAFIDFNIWIRWHERDTTLSLSYGEFAVGFIPVPETHFDYRFEASPYPNGFEPTFGEALFGTVPYPTLGFGGGGVPIWNIALVWAGFLTYFLLKKTDRTRIRS